MVEAKRRWGGRLAHMKKRRRTHVQHQPLHECVCVSGRGRRLSFFCCLCCGWFPGLLLYFAPSLSLPPFSHSLHPATTVSPSAVLPFPPPIAYKRFYQLHSPMWPHQASSSLPLPFPSRFHPFLPSNSHSKECRPPSVLPNCSS